MQIKCDQLDNFLSETYRIIQITRHKITKIRHKKVTEIDRFENSRLKCADYTSNLCYKEEDNFGCQSEKHLKRQKISRCFRTLFYKIHAYFWTISPGHFFDHFSLLIFWLSFWKFWSFLKTSYKFCSLNRNFPK